jgi:tRNA A37 N6-isopentenylltransferase MiaA
MCQAQDELPKEFTEILKDFELNIPQDNKSAIEAKYSSQPDTLHALLTLVDPKMGEYLHSRDTRRIINALFKYFKYRNCGGGLKESEVQTEGNSLRYYPIMVWLRASPGVLEDRITKRIG